MLLRRAIVAGFILTASFALKASATVVQMLDLNEIVAKSDLIVEGKVLSAEGKWVNGHIETTIKLQVSDNIKGRSAAKGGEMILTQLGGSVKEPVPMAMAVPGLATYDAGEEVVLFLQAKPSASPELLKKAQAKGRKATPAIWSSPTTVGGYQGKYNIYTDSTTKKRMVTRQRLCASQGVDASKLPAAVRERIEQSVQMVKKPSARAAASKAAVPAAQGLAAVADHECAAHGAQVPSGAVSLDDFRAQILGAVKKSASSTSTSSSSASPSASSSTPSSSAAAASPASASAAAPAAAGKK